MIVVIIGKIDPKGKTKSTPHISAIGAVIIGANFPNAAEMYRVEFAKPLSPDLVVSETIIVVNGDSTPWAKPTIHAIMAS